MKREGKGKRVGNESYSVCLDRKKKKKKRCEVFYTFIILNFKLIKI